MVLFEQVPAQSEDYISETQGSPHQVDQQV